MKRRSLGKRGKPYIGTYYNSKGEWIGEPSYKDEVSYIDKKDDCYENS